MNDQPWILGISASHNGSACLLKGDEIVVAIQEERLSRFKRHRIRGAGPSKSVAYCLDYAGIEPSDLSLVVLCVQGRLSDEIHNIRREPLLNVIAHNIPTLTIPHHYGHAFSAFATSGFKESAVLIVDGAGSPATDFTAEEQKVMRWFDGGSELGPRALGQRSILCDPRRPDGKEILNRRVKMREAFRPFAPAVLLEEASNWFEFGETTPESPFMLRVVPVNDEKKPKVPAIVHVDGTGRVQTLTRENNARFYDLVKKFHQETGVPMLLNTSFNRMGQPIIETPADAIECLLNSGLDCCLFEDRIVFKA